MVFIFGIGGELENNNIIVYIDGWLWVSENQGQLY